MFCLLFAAGILASGGIGRVKLELERRTLTLATPLQSSYGAVRERELLIVALTGEDGVTGYGEAAPLRGLRRREHRARRAGTRELPPGAGASPAE